MFISFHFEMCMLSGSWLTILSSLFNFKLQKGFGEAAGCSLIGDFLRLGVFQSSCSLGRKQSGLCDGSGEEMRVCESWVWAVVDGRAL